MVTTVAFWSFTQLDGRVLTAPIAFTSLTIFNELRASLNIIPETVIRLFESLISVDRIEKYWKKKKLSNLSQYLILVAVQPQSMTIRWFKS